MSKICSFAGHGDVHYGEDTYKKVINCIRKLVTEENIYEFWVGNYGAFDKLSARAVREVKKEFPQIKLCLVVPYITSELNNEKFFYENKFDEIIVPDISENTPKKLYILYCNRYVAEHSSVLVCFVKRHGGAYETLQHASKNNVEIINIAN